MTDTETIERIAVEVARRIRPQIEDDLWDSECAGLYLKVSARTVAERFAPLPDFPKAIRLPTESGGRGHPRWPAEEIRAWAKKYRERS